MIKRFLKIMILLASFPILLLTVLIGLPIGGLIEISIYIVTGKDNEFDITFAAIDWAIELPYKLTDKF